jgi:hypothetical protein
MTHFMDEPQTELPRFHIGKPCSKLPDQDVFGGEQTHLMHKTLKPIHNYFVLKLSIINRNKYITISNHQVSSFIDKNHSHKGWNILTR